MRTFIRNLSLVSNFKPYKASKWLMPNGHPTGLNVYNCIVHEKVPVILNDPRIATWYSCGPTVYDSAHIGHASCYVKLDIIQRILKSFFNIKLITAMGVTDIDDKIITKAKDTQSDFKIIAKQYEHEFWQDMLSLNIEKPMIITRATEHIQCIEKFVKKLIDSEMAYIAIDGSVYFDTSKYNFYGKLQQMQDSGEPISNNKKNKMDFALWKGHKPTEPYWTVSWGKGRPGWHIECSAMVSKIFGSQVDFHAGGMDLQFPHHENEEAQCCAFHGAQQWANYWIHVGHLHIRGEEKMSKSLKNTISIPELLDQFSADTFRMACLMSNYRYPMEYNIELMNMAEDVLNRFKFFFNDAYNYVNVNSAENSAYLDELLDNLHKVEEDVIEALRSDFDTATCISILNNLISNTNKIIKNDSSTYYPVPVILIADYVATILKKFGLRLHETAQENSSTSVIDTLIEFRHKVRLNALARKDKDLLSECDIVRNKMEAIRVKINDSNKTSSWVFTNKKVL